MMGEIKPTKGKITLHPLMKIGYFAQHSVEELSKVKEGTKGTMTALRYFLEWFLEKEGEVVKEQEAVSFWGS